MCVSGAVNINTMLCGTNNLLGQTKRTPIQQNRKLLWGPQSDDLISLNKRKISGQFWWFKILELEENQKVKDYKKGMTDISNYYRDYDINKCSQPTHWLGIMIIK